MVRHTDLTWLNEFIKIYKGLSEFSHQNRTCWSFIWGASYQCKLFFTKFTV